MDQLTDRTDTEGQRRPERPTPVVVNGRRFNLPQKAVSYAEVVRLAFHEPPAGDDILYTVTYRGGPRPRPQGSLAPGQSTRIRSGMVFNVTATDKS